jgi:hypothetical protein
MSQSGKSKHKNYLNGYVLVESRHPKSFGGQYFEHILVAEIHLGRHLKDWETVHHINEIKDDNRVENLFVCSRREHDKAHGMRNVSFVKLHQKWISKNCTACGREFFGPPHIINKKKKCNSQCKLRKTIEKECNFCYNSYSVPVHAEKHYKYCSKICRLRAKQAA